MRVSSSGPVVSHATAPHAPLAKQHTAVGSLVAKARGLTAADRAAIHWAAGQPGLVGVFQVKRGLARVAGLNAHNMTLVRDALELSATPHHRALVFKELATDSTLEQVAAFARAIEPLRGPRLHSMTSIALTDSSGVGPDRGLGLIQTFGNSCVPAVAQALRGWVQPSYALALRTANESLGEHHRHNPTLRAEQEALLSSVGSRPASRATGIFRLGTPWEAIADVFNRFSAHTGLRYERRALRTERGELHRLEEARAAAVAAMFDQVEKGMPTPFSVGGEAFNARDRHAMVALETRGEGAAATLVVLNPANASVRHVGVDLFRRGLVPGGPSFDAYFAALPQ